MILGEMTDADKRVNPQHFWSDPVDIWIPKSGFESRITFWAWQSLRSPCAFVSICNCSYILVFVCITSHYKPTSSCPRRSHLQSATSGHSTFLARRLTTRREVLLSMDQLSGTAYLLNFGHLTSCWTFSKPN